jgi:hypothetical protein
MNRVSGLRQCFRQPIAELYDAARLLDAAVVAHMSRQRALAAELLVSANMPVVRDWLNSIWGSKSEYVSYRATPESKPLIPKAERTPLRMPTVETRLRLHRRDGFHCRCCGIPVIRTEVRKFFYRQYPQLRIWGTGNDNQHAAFQALWVQYDHILPHALGGTNDFENLLIACAACNYGRMQFTFAEVGLHNPMTREPIRSLWDGLERVLPSSPFAAMSSNPSMQPTGRKRPAADSAR